MDVKAAAALMAACALAGCAMPYSPVPVATNFPNTEQPKLQAAAHWDVIARHVQQTLSNDLKKASPRPFYVPEPKANASEFEQALTSHIITSLVNAGHTVSLTPAGALKVDLKVQAVTFAANRPQYRYRGEATALATGLWVLSDIDPTVGAVGTVAALDTYSWFRAKFAPGATPKTEVIVTVSVTDQYRYLARTSSAYYVADADAALYNGALVKEYKLRGDR
ncbi:hypothetical protein [Pseudoduganella violacea]|uniref:Lipoprotein n=1 Tax=Pseudoduganella violacea TaxID=1715466 RepID=A0A7W5BFK8_9BURK|nr:hypothetical protein [Pseudoduganella violacea]MBB3122218.1 hypothetical protein [Pseudoduganella violacea]